MKGFTNENIKFDVLRQRAYNMRWAEQDTDVIPLTAADHDFPCAPEVVQALQDYIKEGYFTYTPHRGFPSFKQAIAKAMKERKNEDVNPDFVLPIDSAARGMKVIADAVLQPGDEVIVFDPVDFLFRTSMESAGAKVILFPTNLQSDCVSLEGLEDYITPKTKMLGFCNPHNPVGRVWTEDEVRKIVELCKKYSVWLFSDEIHGDVVLYGHQYTSAARFADVYDHMLVYTAISKTFNMAGLHSSCTIIPNPEYKKIQEDTLRQAWLMSPNCMANSAIEACYTYGDEWVDEQNAYLTENAEFVTSYLKEHAPQIKPVKPEGTYLMWLDCSELSMTSEEIVKILASEYKMAVGGGAGYQGNGEYFLRFNIGCPRETLEKGMEILAQFVADKKGV